jgi:hypothetical protein
MRTDPQKTKKAAHNSASESSGDKVRVKSSKKGSAVAAHDSDAAAEVPKSIGSKSMKPRIQSNTLVDSSGSTVVSLPAQEKVRHLLVDIRCISPSFCTVSGCDGLSFSWMLML